MSPQLIALVLFSVLSVTLGQTELHGSGTTNPSKLIWKAMSILEEETKAPTRMTYRAIGSGGGQAEFVAGVNDFGAGDIPLGATDFETMTVTNGKTVLHIPFVIGAVSFFHSVPNMPNLKLSGCVLAGIYQGTITAWDDPAIKALNPGFNPPSGQKIHAARREHGSSSTSAMSAYLSAASAAAGCSNAWTIGVGKGGDGKAPTWPAALAAKQGSDGMAGYLDSQPYAIAYVDSGHGVALGLHEVHISNKDGQYLTSTTGDIAGAASVLQLPASDASWANVNPIYAAGPRTWPMVAFSYFYVVKDQSATGNTGALLKGFLEYMLSDKVKGMLPRFGFSAIPDTARQQAKTAVESITLGGGVTPWTFEYADITRKIDGAGPHVFSAKRRTYEEYQLGVHDMQLADMMDHFKMLQDKVKELEEKVKTLESTPSTSGQAPASGSGATASFNVNFYNNQPNGCPSS